MANDVMMRIARSLDRYVMSFHYWTEMLLMLLQSQTFGKSDFKWRDDLVVEQLPDG